MLEFINFDLGIAHRSMKEDVYRGYYIPAGMLPVRLSYQFMFIHPL